MTCYSLQRSNRTFVKGYWFLIFARNMKKNIGKIINKNLSDKYTQKLFDHAKQSGTDTKLIQKEQFKKQQKQLVI